jgi:hypothetical protein
VGRSPSSPGRRKLQQTDLVFKFVFTSPGGGRFA